MNSSQNRGGLSKAVDLVVGVGHVDGDWGYLPMSSALVTWQKSCVVNDKY